ncbi:MAG: hypothetical protein RMN53_07230 [Anaerolineae bacterium]|nr:hypothetical protein [Anaerolineae bacterium]
MSLSRTAIGQRAAVLVRGKLVLDAGLAALLVLTQGPQPALAVVALDALSLLAYGRAVVRWPALATLVTLTASALLLSLAPLALGALGLALWTLIPLIPPAAGYVLGRPRQAWQAAGLAALALALAVGLLWREGQPLTLAPWHVVALGAGLAVSLLGVSWLVGHAFGADQQPGGLLGEPLAVVRGVLVAPLLPTVAAIGEEALQAELRALIRSQAPRWVVLDLAGADTLSGHDLAAVEHAAVANTSAQCTVVLARPPLDAVSHLDVAQPLIGRAERFATVPQAVEAGLRRLGWTQATEQGQRVVTTYFP